MIVVGREALLVHTYHIKASQLFLAWRKRVMQSDLEDKDSCILDGFIFLEFFFFSYPHTNCFHLSVDILYYINSLLGTTDSRYIYSSLTYT